MVVGGCRVGRYGDEITPLWWAANDGQVETARRLLAGRDGWEGVEVDRTTTNDRTTPLVQAASQNFPEVVEVLLEHRADANKGKCDGATPLMFAAQKGSVQAVKLLLAAGADVNKAAPGKETTLHLASYHGHKDVVVTLLTVGSDKRERVAGSDRAFCCAFFGPRRDYRHVGVTSDVTGPVPGQGIVVWKGMRRLSADCRVREGCDGTAECVKNCARRQRLRRRQVRACRWQESEDTGAADCEGSWLGRWKACGWLGGRVVEWSRERRHGEACFFCGEKFFSFDTTWVCGT